MKGASQTGGWTLFRVGSGVGFVLPCGVPRVTHVFLSLASPVAGVVWCLGSNICAGMWRGKALLVDLAGRLCLTGLAEAFPFFAL